MIALNRLLIALRLVIITTAVAALAGCESSRHGEKCIGIDGKQKPGVEYELSVNNLIVGVLFIETVIVPVYVVAKQIRCPTGPAKEPTK